MRIPFRRLCTAFLVLCFPLLLAGRLSAAPAPPGPLLIQAYVTLAHADHDYKGHRGEAMKHIEAAGKALGINVRGDGLGHEPQHLSDNQLLAARSMLEQARFGLHGRAARHVDKALNQLSIALRVR